MSVVTKSKELGGIVLGLALLIGLLTLCMVVLNGIAAFSLWVMHWTFPAFGITFLISLVLLLLALIPLTRAVAAFGFLFASFSFGAILWLWCMAYTYSVWGIFPVVLGIVLGGIGVVPIGMFASLVHGDWSNLGLFIGTAVLMIGERVMAQWLAAKVDQRAAKRSEITVQGYRVQE